MPKYKITTLSPIHISNGEEYELNYNLLVKDNFIYLYDEFTLVEYFIAHNIAIPSNLDELKRVIADRSSDIIDSNLHLRKIESNFSNNLDKPLLSHITTAEFPIIPGSSIKGSIRTAILDCMVNSQKICTRIINKCRDKKFDKKRFNKRFNNDLAEIYKYIKVTDSFTPLETKVYKTINIKKEKSHQAHREKKVEKIANYVEAIKPGQSFEIEIKDISEDQIFHNLGQISNKFYIPFFANDEKQYFTKETGAVEIVKNAQKGVFIINIGRFSGAERKSINNLRDIKSSKSSDKLTTTARTFALEKDTRDKVFFEHKLLPFGWIMCEKLENSTNTKHQSINNIYSELRRDKFEAIDRLNELKQNKIEKRKRILEEKQREEEERKIRLAEEKAQKEAKLAAMTPMERKIEELHTKEPNTPIITLIIKSIEDDLFGELKCEAVKLAEKVMKKEKKWKETTSAKKPEKDKTYQQTLKVLQMLKEC